MITWPALEHAAQQAGWKRTGRTWRGAPCPSCGGGTRDTAWVGPGSTAAFVAGCNAGCNGLEVARALVPDGNPSPVVWREPRTRAARADADTSQGQRSPELPAAVWRASEALQAQPGAPYLTARGLPGPWPVSVRWLPTESARRVGLHPSLPAGAAGAILYRFASPDDGGTRHALQVEAVNADGARLAFATAGKRPSVWGSTFTHGARVFLARDGGPGVALCESVLDALAVGRYPWGAPSGEAVIAGAGTSGLQAAAVRRWPGPVTIWAHGDGPGRRAALVLRLRLETAGRAVTINRQWLRAVRLQAALREAGRAVTIQRPLTDGLRRMDWADVAQLEYDERKGIQHE